MLMPEKVKLVQIYRVVINKPNELLVETLFLMRNWTGNEFLVISLRKSVFGGEMASLV